MICATRSRSARCSTPTARGEPIGPRLCAVHLLWGTQPSHSYWYLEAAPELLALASRAPRAASRRRAMSRLAPTMQAFFTDRLIRERNASPNTIAAYRDTMRLLLALRLGAARQSTVQARHRRSRRPLDRRVPRPPRARPRLQPAHPQRASDRDPLALPLCRTCHPEHAAVIERVLAIPPKRHGRPLITFLTEHETDALIARPTARPGPAGATARC